MKPHKYRHLVESHRYVLIELIHHTKGDYQKQYDLVQDIERIFENENVPITISLHS